MTPTTLIMVKTGRATAQARRGDEDFEDWFATGLGPERFDRVCVRVDEGQSLPPVEALMPATAVVVTGSPAMVSDRLDWSERTARWLVRAHAGGLSILGVCYGHQLLAHALGGRVGPNPRGRRMGRSEVDVVEAEDPLMAPFAPRAAFHVTHVESVLEPPTGARVVATAQHDPFHALYFGGTTWGVQFHPEFDRETMRRYITARADALVAEGQDPATLLARLDGPTRGAELLERFGRIATGSVSDHDQ